MTRITAKSLEPKVAKLNELLGRPATAYTKKINGGIDGNEGHIMLDHNTYYGGAILTVMQSNTGQCHFNGICRRVSLREMSKYLDGIITGLTMKK